MSEPARKGATVEDFHAIPEDRRFHELIGGVITERTEEATG